MCFARYDNMDQHRLLARGAVHFKNRSMLSRRWQVMGRTVAGGGLGEKQNLSFLIICVYRCLIVV